MDKLLPALCCAVFLFFFAGCQPAGQQESMPDMPWAADEDNQAASVNGADGLSQACFDSVVRLRNRTGTGCGNAVAFLRKRGIDFNQVESIQDATHVEIETNRHVIGDRTAPCVVDCWSEGDLVASVRAQTDRSWFEEGTGKDVATIRLDLEKLQGPLAVIPTAPYGSAVSVGDKVFTVGCSDARWPRARCANVIRISDGLIWTDPVSIGGDSGGPVFQFSVERGRFETVGRTAWAIQTDAGWACLSMTSDRVHDIRSGRVSTFPDLPDGAIPISELRSHPDFQNIALPVGACFPEERQLQFRPLPAGFESNLDLAADRVGETRKGRTQTKSKRKIDQDEPAPLQVVETAAIGWRFRKGEDGKPLIEPRRPQRRRPGPVRSVLAIVWQIIVLVWRFPLFVSLALLAVFVWVAPTMLTRLDYTWPARLIGSMFSRG